MKHDSAGWIESPLFYLSHSPLYSLIFGLSMLDPDGLGSDLQVNRRSFANSVDLAEFPTARLLEYFS